MILVLRKKRSRTKESAATQLADNSTECPPFPAVPRAPIATSAQEIGNNSMIGPVREMPDSGRAELLVEHYPSGRRNGVLGMPGVMPCIAHELRTARSSQLMLRTSKPDYGQNFLSRRIAREGCTGVASSDVTSIAESVESVPDCRKDLDHDIASSVTSSLKVEIYSYYLRKPLDLNRSLPPTPISESPQRSPKVAKLKQGPSPQQGPPMVKASTRRSWSACVSREMPVRPNSTPRDVPSCKDLSRMIPKPLFYRDQRSSEV